MIETLSRLTFDKLFLLIDFRDVPTTYVQREFFFNKWRLNCDCKYKYGLNEIMSSDNVKDMAYAVLAYFEI
jgi:hypothetical protein